MAGISRKQYIFHFRPKTVPAAAIRYTYTWGLGGMAATLVLLLMLTGLMLKFVYIPSPDKAYASVVALQQRVVFGGLIRNIHFWSANLLIMIVFLHLLRVFFTGAYKDKNKSTWVTGLCIMGFILGANFTGYLLPWDQLAYWAVTIITAMLVYLPGIGGWLQEMIIGGPELGPQTLSNFFALHTAIIPTALVVLLPFHFWRIRKAGGLAASQGEKIEAFPNLIIHETATALMVVAVVMLLAAMSDASLGAKANPGLSPNPTKAPWYFAGLQEFLLHMHPLLAVAVIPVVTAAALFLLPFLPYRIATPGHWFGSPSGRRLAAGAAMTAMVLTPLWVIGHARGMAAMTWLAPLVFLGVVAGLLLLSKRIFGTTAHDAVQAAVSFLLTVFILLTATGIWFRGASMALGWPW